jgi:dihydroneopterin aldolase
MDKIIIKNACFLCNAGVSQEERRKKQEIFIDIKLFLDIKKASQTDDINKAINYSTIHKSIKNLSENKKYKLIETMAEDIAKNILENFDISEVLVRIKKPQALAKKNVSYVAVEIVRSKYDRDLYRAGL